MKKTARRSRSRIDLDLREQFERKTGVKLDRRRKPVIGPWDESAISSHGGLNNAIDWSAIESDLKTISAYLQPMKIADRKERRAYESYKEDPFKWGAWNYPGSEERQQRIHEFNDDVRVLEPDLKIIQEAIIARAVSTVFLKAWAYLHTLVGRQIELLAQEDDAKKAFDRGISAGRSQNSDRWRVWVAHWLLERTNDNKSKLKLAKNDLQDLIWKKELPPGCIEGVSKRIVEKISWKEIKRLTSST